MCWSRDYLGGQTTKSISDAKCKIYIKGIEAGTLTENDNGSYSFEYEPRCRITHIPSESYTIEDEVDYASLIESVKNRIGSIPAIEVFFSTEFIYKEKGSDINLFSTINYGIDSILSLLIELDKEIGIEASKTRKILQDKIAKLKFHRIPKDAWFIDDYVFYREGNVFEKGERFEVITPITTGVKYTHFCELLHVPQIRN